MVFGNGVFARAFKKYEENPDVVIFASGVSNSKTTDIKEFQREKNLVKQVTQKHKSEKFVYFSTCSIEDKELVESAYVKHKMEMELLLSTIIHNYLIIRVPQIVGPSVNPHTIINFLCSKILTGEKFDLWEYASRSIIDIDDVEKVVSYIIRSTSLKNRILSIPCRSYAMREIVESLENVLGKKANCNFVKKGASYIVQDAVVEKIIKNQGIEFEYSYLENTFRKYYTN
jgi:nucleoside-diphosphate-sugar epimerase